MTLAAQIESHSGPFSLVRSSWLRSSGLACSAGHVLVASLRLVLAIRI